jgi:hypothetical protein
LRLSSFVPQEMTCAHTRPGLACAKRASVGNLVGSLDDAGLLATTLAIAKASAKIGLMVL